MARTRLKWALAITVLAVAATPAIAQTTGSAGADARVNVSRPVSASAEAQIREVDQGLQRMDMGRSGIRRQLEVSRAQRDVVKTLCLNDKLNQADVTKRTAKERADAHKAAHGRHDTELANHEFAIFKVLVQRHDQHVAEANACVGEQEAFTGLTRVTQNVDPNLPPPSRETEFPQGDPTLVTEVPKCTSCVR